MLNSTLKETVGEDFFKELSPEEVVDQLVLGDNSDINVYARFCEFIQGSLLPAEGVSDLIFAPTTRALRFYRSYFRKQLTDVLFVGVNDPEDPEAIISHFSAPDHKDEQPNEEEKSEQIDTQYERYK